MPVAMYLTKSKADQLYLRRDGSNDMLNSLNIPQGKAFQFRRTDDILVPAMTYNEAINVVLLGYYGSILRLSGTQIDNQQVGWRDFVLKDKLLFGMVAGQLGYAANKLWYYDGAAWKELAVV